MEINRREFMRAGALAALAGATGRSEAEKYEVGAYYFPNWAPDPRLERIHGKGWTEWELLKRGEPKFPGHLQPKRPAWGYEDESDPRVFEKKIAAAHTAGLSHFIFDWYWYEGKPFLERGLERGYLNAANKADVRFCLMWANHDWLDLMPCRLDKDTRLLFKGAYDSAAFDVAVDYVISHYFREPSYYRINGAPYFSIYMLQQMIQRMGGIDIARPALDRFRQKTRSAGFPDLHLNAVAWGVSDMGDVRRDLPALGVNSVTSYTWAHHYSFPTFPAVEYQEAAEQAPAYWSKAKDLFGVPYHLDVSMGWDPSPRTCQSDMFADVGYPYTSALVNNTPENFERALRNAKTYLDQHGELPRIVTINAWNEWTEGSYLEPDSVHGSGYLDAIQKVFGS
jgi:hypothetical protein